MTARGKYRVQVLCMGDMAEVPSCGVRYMSGLTEFEPFCYTAVVAQSDEHCVVINTGFPEDITPMEDFFRELHPRCVLRREPSQTIAHQLARINVDPACVDHLVVTPPGPYSSGQIDRFANATIHIGRRAWMDVVAPCRHVPPANPHHLAIPPHTMRALVSDFWPRLRLAEDEDELCPGIRVFRTGGHHNGSLAVMIDTELGTVAYADTVFKYTNLEENTPPGFCRNLDDWWQGVARLKREADVIVPAFDPCVFQRYADGVIADG